MINYLYLDDFANPKKKDDYHKVNQIANSFRLKGKLDVVLLKPIDWKFQLKNIAYIFGLKKVSLPKEDACLSQLNYLKTTLGLEKIEDLKNFFSGVILDLRLDEKLDVGYKGTTVAQELRQRATQKTMKEIPLILCTGNNFYKQFYKKDSTTHDLFDLTFIKDDIEARCKKNKDSIAARKLIALAKGYVTLSEKVASNKKIFGVNKTQFIDNRIIEKFNFLRENNKAIHIYARFILKELIGKAGELISEDILAARFGLNIIDIKKQKETLTQWEKFKENFDACKYDGVFNNFSPRWWSHLLLEWWEDEFGPNPLAQHTAVERVEMINKKYNTKFIVFKKNDSSLMYYWTICKKSLIPIDIQDGLVLNTLIKHPWQDKEYVSKNYAVEKNLNPKEVSPIDRSKFEFLKKVHFSNKKKPSRKKRK